MTGIISIKAEAYSTAKFNVLSTRPDGRVREEGHGDERVNNYNILSFRERNAIYIACRKEAEDSVQVSQGIVPPGRVRGNHLQWKRLRSLGGWAGTRYTADTQNLSTATKTRSKMSKGQSFVSRTILWDGYQLLRGNIHSLQSAERRP